jgi:hypothetical protein
MTQALYAHMNNKRKKKEVSILSTLKLLFPPPTPHLSSFSFPLPLPPYPHDVIAFKPGNLGRHTSSGSL